MAAIYRGGEVKRLAPLGEINPMPIVLDKTTGEECWAQQNPDGRVRVAIERPHDWKTGRARHVALIGTFSQEEFDARFSTGNRSVRWLMGWPLRRPL